MTMPAGPGETETQGMKIGKPVPPQSVADVARLPAGPAGSVPQPLPNVPAGSSFEQAHGAERRFSTRFVTSLPAQLQRLDVSPRLQALVTDRFSAMSRGEVDRFGRLAETVMASRRPAEGLALLEGLLSVGTVSERGPRVAPEAVVQAYLALVSLSPPALAGAAVHANVAAVTTVIQSMPMLMSAAAVMADEAGLHDVADGLRQGSGDLGDFLDDSHIRVAVTIAVLASSALTPTGALALLQQAGRSAAASPRADADLERGVLLLHAGAGASQSALTELAQRVRGEARHTLEQRLARGG